MLRVTLLVALLAHSSLALKGGSTASQGQFPSHVGLANAFGSLFCSGSIVNNQWVLTAAQCVWDEVSSPNNVKVHAGSNRIAAGTKYDVDRIIVHGSFNIRELSNDVAVLHTVQTINFNGNVQPVPLIARELNEEEVVLPGWGRSELTGPLSSDLQYIYYFALTYDDCLNRVEIKPDNICAFVGIGTGLCIGDTGGGSYLDDEGLVGIASFYADDCGGGYPDGLASVLYHRAWIVANTN